MRLLLRARGPEGCDVEMAVVEFDAAELLSLMDGCPKIDGFLSMRVVDYARWYEDNDLDVLDVLDDEPLVEFEYVELVRGMPVEAEALVVNRNCVHWTGIVKHTDWRVSTDALTREYLLSFKDAIQRLKEAIDAAPG